MKASESREAYNTEFAFSGSFTIVSYVSKKEMAVVLLRTMYHNKMGDENTRKGKKHKLITFYNKTKGGVDTVDKMVGTYTCKCKT